MRISDWSSDVCSSDLDDRSALRRRPGPRSPTPRTGPTASWSCSSTCRSRLSSVVRVRKTSTTTRETAMTPTASSTRCRRDTSALPHRVADPPDGVDQLGLDVIDLASEVADVGLHHPAVAVEVVVPDVVEDLGLRQHPALVDQQEIGRAHV